MIGLYHRQCSSLTLQKKKDTLDGQVSLESVVGFRVVEDLFKRRILQRGTVNITGDPVVVEHRCALDAFFFSVLPLLKVTKRDARYRHGTCNPLHK